MTLKNVEIEDLYWSDFPISFWSDFRKNYAQMIWKLFIHILIFFDVQQQKLTDNNNAYNCVGSLLLFLLVPMFKKALSCFIVNI